MDRREFLTGTVGCAALMATGNPLIPRPANLPAPQKPYRLGLGWGADEWMLEMRKGECLWASRALSGLDGPGRALCVISHDYQVPVANIPAALFL